MKISEVFKLMLIISHYKSVIGEALGLGIDLTVISPLFFMARFQVE
jgi:hypothetical protein